MSKDDSFKESTVLLRGFRPNLKLGKRVADKVQESWGQTGETSPEHRQELLRRLGDLWSQHPDLRLGQLVVWFVGENKDPFHTTDAEALHRIEKALLKESP